MKNKNSEMIPQNLASVSAFSPTAHYQDSAEGLSNSLLSCLREILESMATGTDYQTSLDTAILLSSRPISASNRLDILQKLSQVLGACMMNPSAHSANFDRLYHLMTAINIWLDRIPSESAAREELEWDELQKCVILITDLEDSLSARSQASYAIN